MTNDEYRRSSMEQISSPFITTTTLDINSSSKNLPNIDNVTKEQSIQILKIFNANSSSSQQMALSQIDKTQQNDKGKFNSIKPIYIKFIKKTFAKENHERLRTFEKFAFSSVERDDHKDLTFFLNEIKSPSEPTGSMNVVDLWPFQLQRAILKKTCLQNEKKMVEKFAYNFAKFNKNQMNPCRSVEKRALIFSKKEENIYKDFLHMKVSGDEFAKKQMNRTNLKLKCTSPSMLNDKDTKK